MTRVPTDAPVFVAGHAGLVGSALVRRLRAVGFRNVLTVPRRELDLRDQAAVHEWFVAHRPRYVYVAAGTVGGILASSTRPGDFIYDNLMIHANVINASHLVGLLRLLEGGARRASAGPGARARVVRRQRRRLHGHLPHDLGRRLPEPAARTHCERDARMAPPELKRAGTEERATGIEPEVVYKRPRNPSCVTRSVCQRASLLPPGPPCTFAWLTMQAVTATSNAKVSHRGQTSLPAELRHRWGIADGGEVGFIDLGDAALVVPGGVVVARRELRRVLGERYDEGLASLDDPELADQ